MYLEGPTEGPPNELTGHKVAGLRTKSAVRSLRSSLEMSCYDSDDANPRSVSSLSNRSSPLSWRYGQSSPRLQAGDAPSVGGSCRSEGPPAWYMHGERAHYSHTMPMRSPSKLSHISRLELVESLDSDEVDLKSGYMSDSDLMGKTMTEDDDITTG